MKSILKDTSNSEKLLNMTSDTLILMDKDGVCVDIALHNVDLWFLNEEKLLGKEPVGNLLPSSNLQRVLSGIQESPDARRTKVYPQL